MGCWLAPPTGWLAVAIGGLGVIEGDDGALGGGVEVLGVVGGGFGVGVAVFAMDGTELLAAGVLGGGA